MIRWVRRWWYWGLDYWYVGWWQVVGFVRRSPPKRYGEGDRAPVVLLPGVYETWALLMPIASALNAAGHPVYTVPRLGYNRHSIVDSAAIVAQRIAELGLTGVLLVAHSKGGLIGKHAILVDDTDARIDRLISISTPYAGSSLARYFPTRSVLALRPQAETVGWLASNVDANARIVSIYGEFDPHIPDGCHLEGAVNIEIDVVGHFRVLGDHRVIAAVLEAAR